VAQIAGMLCRNDVVHDHLLDAPLAVGRLREDIAQLQRDRFGQVLVFGDGEHLFFGELGKVETILECQHGVPPAFAAPPLLPEYFRIR